jgi:probable rRNA maturation factor
MILNRQRNVRVPIRKLERFAAKASELLHLPADSVAVCLVSNKEMASWNHAYRGKAGPTDVLSFPAAEPGRGGSRRNQRVFSRGNSAASGRNGRSFWSSAEDGSGSRHLGDIAIAPSVARRNALRFGRSFEDEMRILILHGMLHLMGYDHETDTGQMDRRERSLRRSLDLE